ncbi:Maf family protein [Sphingoaurantiacus capsulatus]|uniref:Nucleoside triphosphate pyrophosphatase n=1 Tax=Sphingoaurantiacus capsulatus TaxID=1771310 RepID=A0ABV7XE41_9SPHN
MTLVLASTSAARRVMLTAAGVAHEALAPHVDEDEVKTALTAEGASPRAIADALAEAKAVKLSRKLPGALVLGADQVLALPDGTMLDKPVGREGAAAQLRSLRGIEHRLISAAVIAENGQAVWRVADTATLQVRQFSEAWLEAYLDAEGDAILGCVGSYRLEAMGAQLFSRIRGDHFTILGLPLLAVLDYLRTRGELTT